MVRKRQQISIKEEDFDLIPYYKSKGNYSKFILNCVRYYKDKEDKENNELDEEQIVEIVEKYLKKRNSEI